MTAALARRLRALLARCRRTTFADPEHRTIWEREHDAVLARLAGER